MGNFDSLKTAIVEVIKQNGNEEITGDVLQFVLLEMVSGLGAGYRFLGTCTPSTEPQEPDGAAFYVGGAGEYLNFGGVNVGAGYICFFKWDGSAWSGSPLKVTQPIDTEVTQGGENPVKGGAIYDAIKDLSDEIMAELGQKVDKVEGKGLSEADFTNSEKLKLNNLPTAAGLTDLLDFKQDRLDFDNEPEEGSINPVTSNGIHEAIKYFITKAVNDLLYYYKKSEVYTKEEVDVIVAGISQVEIIAVEELPEASAATMGKIFLVPAEVGDSMDEYITLRSTEGGVVSYYWQKIGSSDIDLSNYPTIDDMNAAIASAIGEALAGYYTKQEVDEKVGMAVGNLAEIMLESDKDVILVDTETAVTVVGRSEVAAESLVISREGVEKAAGSGKAVTVSETLQTDDDVVYLLTAVIGGVEKTKELTIKAVGAVYYGAGSDVSEIITKASPRKRAEGFYTMSAQTGDNLFVLVPDGMTINGMRMNGVDVPLDTPTGVFVEEAEYLCYKSANVYEAGNYVIEVY